MKKGSVILLMLMFLFAGCSETSKANVPEVDQMTIFYGVSSYAMFGSDRAVIDDLYDKFSSLEFEKTNEKIDLMSMFSVNLVAKGKGSIKFSVDKNGVFWVTGDAQSYRIKSGTFDYAYLKKVYEGSRNK